MRTKKKELNKKIESLQKQVKRFKQKYLVTYKCLQAKQQGVKISDLIKQVSGKDVEKLAIYGTGELGLYFLQELLKEQQIEILYCLDQKQEGMVEGIPVFHPSAELELPDLILITPIGVLKEIEDVLAEKMHTFDTMSVEELIEL